jgi:hypothetical protein
MTGNEPQMAAWAQDIPWGALWAVWGSLSVLAPLGYAIATSRNPRRNLDKALHPRRYSKSRQAAKAINRQQRKRH